MKEWAYPYEVERVTVGAGIRMAYVDEGEGPVLLFIHGLGSNLKGWKKNIDVLRKHYRCIALDLPNYGKSSGGDFSFSMTFFATKVLEFIQSLKIGGGNPCRAQYGRSNCNSGSLEWKSTDSEFSVDRAGWFRTFFQKRCPLTSKFIYVFYIKGHACFSNCAEF
jgi:hypothetical protein